MPSKYLTKKEVVEFLSTQLNLHLNDAELTGLPTLDLLQKICTAFTENVPYSTVKYLTIPIEQRGLPTLEEIKQIGLQKIGGLCYETNVFLHWLLAGCGFDVDFLLAKVYGGSVYNHACNVVHVDGHDYLVDGGSLPTTTLENLICLDFDGHVSPTSVQSIWEVRVERRLVDGQAGFVGKFRWTDKVAIPQWNIPIDETGWATFTEFPLVRRSLEEMGEALRICYTDATVAPIINRILCFRFPKGRLLQIRNTVVYYEVEGRERREIQARSRDELVDLIHMHYGDLYGKDMIQRAVDHYVQLVKSPPGFLSLQP